MTNRKERAEVEVFPPRAPLEYPLGMKDVMLLLGVSKSTLFRWEKDGLIPPFPRMSKGQLDERQVGPQDLTRLMTYLKEIRTLKGKAVYPCLENFDPTVESSISFPSGYEVVFKGSKNLSN